PVSNLVLPVGVHEGVLAGHGHLVIHAAGAGNLRGDEPIEAQRGDTAFVEALPEQVGGTLPGGDAGQVRGLHGGDAPLVHGNAGVAGHTYLAVAPVLHGQPLHEVVAVLPVLVSKHMYVALGVAGPPHVHVGHRVALVAPVHGVGALELG